MFPQMKMTDMFGIIAGEKGKRRKMGKKLLDGKGLGATGCKGVGGIIVIGRGVGGGISCNEI